MKHLHPIATPETRHLFIDPIIRNPWPILSDGYGSEHTSYIKPGVVPNLMLLCKPEDARFSITEEPNMDELYIKQIVFGAFDVEGAWKNYFAVSLKIKLTSDGCVGCSIKDTVKLPTAWIFELDTGNKADLLGSELSVELDVKYERGTRRLTFKPTGSYDSGKPEVHGIVLNLEHKDSKLV